jgi:hypothetical protein
MPRPVGVNPNARREPLLTPPVHLFPQARREGRSGQLFSLRRHGRARPGHPRLFADQKESRGCPAHRQAEATPFFERLWPGMTILLRVRTRIEPLPLNARGRG